MEKKQVELQQETVCNGITSLSCLFLFLILLTNCILLYYLSLLRNIQI